MFPAAVTLTVLFAVLIVFALLALVVARRRWPAQYEYWVAPWDLALGEEPKPQYHRTEAPVVADHE